MMKQLMTAALAVSLLAGCSFLAQHSATAKIATQYATIKVIDGDPGKAARVASIATEVRRYASGEPHLTVDRLIQAVRDRIDWASLDAADTLLVTALLDHLRAELTARLGPDILPGDLRLAVDKVASWVAAAARLTPA